MTPYEKAQLVLSSITTLCVVYLAYVTLDNSG